jgi:hypothetical protein
MYGDSKFTTELGGLGRGSFDKSASGIDATGVSRSLALSENLDTNVASYIPTVLGERVGDAKRWKGPSQGPSQGIAGIASGGAPPANIFVTAIKDGMKGLDLCCDNKGGGGGLFASLFGERKSSEESPAKYTSVSKEQTAKLAELRSSTDQLNGSTGQAAAAISNLVNNGVSINNINELYTQMTEAVRNGLTEAFSANGGGEANTEGGTNATVDVSQVVTHKGSIAMDFGGDISIKNLEQVEENIMAKMRSELMRILPDSFGIPMTPPSEGGTDNA